MTQNATTRRLQLQGGCNFRDLGGYQGRLGTTRWGMIYRSGTPGGLTQDDMSRLLARGIRASCDFRSNSERRRHPSPWSTVPEVIYWCRDHERSDGDLSAVLAPKGDPETAGLRIMRRMYGDLPMSQRENYRAMFARIAAGDLPMVFNCSAGKDRAGVAAALLLEALGIDRETIIADYLLTNEAPDLGRAQAIRESGEDDRLAAALRSLPPPVEAALWRADVSYIEAMFACLDAQHASIERYLGDVLEIDRQALTSIRTKLLDCRAARQRVPIPGKRQSAF